MDIWNYYLENQGAASLPLFTEWSAADTFIRNYRPDLEFGVGSSFVAVTVRIEFNQSASASLTTRETNGFLRANFLFKHANIFLV